MSRREYALVKRRCHVARQRAVDSGDPQAWREYERAKRERDRAYAQVRS